MKATATRVITAALLALCAHAAPAAELAETLQRLAGCQDSWLDWKNDEQRMRAFGDALMGQFRPSEQHHVFVPQGRVTWMGYEVSEITPQNIGMALGFAITVKAPLAKLRAGYERVVGQPMKACENNDGLSSCELQLAKRKTATMMMPIKKPELGTLLGCYYYYQQ